MKASKIKNWPSTFKASDWPEGVLENMSADIIVNGVFALRNASLIPMWPSSLYEAHVRTEGNSRHSTKDGSRLSDATDMHVKTIGEMLRVMCAAESIPAIGGIGVYFNTNAPMVHIDMRSDRLVWLCTQWGEYIYRENDPVKFYLTLAEELSQT